MIDERKLLSDRINEVRDLFVQKIHVVKDLKNIYSIILHDYKQLAVERNSALSETKKKSKEMKTYEEIKVKLQDVCRLYQKQTKDVAEENIRLEISEEENMISLESRCVSTIEDINSKLFEQKELQKKQIEDNDQLKEKLTQFEDHSKLREVHFSTQLKAKALEILLFEAKYEQQLQLLKHEKSKCEAYKMHIHQLHGTEVELKSQLQQYTEKFDHFQDALSRSNSMFTQFEEKMSTMSLNMEKLAEENVKLKRICSNLDVELIGLVCEKQNLNVGLQAMKQEKSRMEKTCRQAQTRRMELASKLQFLVLENPQFDQRKDNGDVTITSHVVVVKEEEVLLDVNDGTNRDTVVNTNLEGTRMYDKCSNHAIPEPTC